MTWSAKTCIYKISNYWIFVIYIINYKECVKRILAFYVLWFVRIRLDGMFAYIYIEFVLWLKYNKQIMLITNVRIQEFTEMGLSFPMNKWFHSYTGLAQSSMIQCLKHPIHSSVGKIKPSSNVTYKYRIIQKNCLHIQTPHEIPDMMVCTKFKLFKVIIGKKCTYVCINTKEIFVTRSMKTSPNHTSGKLLPMEFSNNILTSHASATANSSSLCFLCGWFLGHVRCAWVPGWL